MGQIRIFNRPPKAFEFDKEDLVIDNVRGDIYYKDDRNRLQKIIKSDDPSTSLSVANLIATTSISSSAITSSVVLTGNITASGNISASGIIIANAFQSDGEQQITVADSFNITGSVTSSGDISASGIVIANEANIIGNITSSGNISSSGTGTNHLGGQVNINSNFAQLRLSDDNFSDFISLGQSGPVGYIKTSDADNNFKFRRGSDNTDLVEIFFGDERIHISGSGGLDVTGHITASGEISASGRVTTLQVGRDSTDQIDFSNEANIIGNITSSGNISSSGTIIGSNLSGTNTGDQSLDHLAITGSNVIFGNITSSGNISSSQASTISGGTGSFRRLLLGDTNVAALTADLHIRNAGSVNINLDSFDQNGNQIINFLNNQEPDFSIGNYFSDGGFQIRSDQKRFAKFGADDGDIIELSGSLHVTGSNGNIITDGNISASGYISSSEINVGGGTFTSASLAAAQASGDNLGNHTATQNLSLGNFDITSSKNIIGITGSFNQTVVTLKAGAQDSPFLIKIADSNGQDNKLEVTKDGILKFGALDTLPTAITGGLVYSASAFYAGL